jgi:hypothetical protein
MTKRRAVPATSPFIVRSGEEYGQGLLLFPVSIDMPLAPSSSPPLLRMRPPVQGSQFQGPIRVKRTRSSRFGFRVANGAVNAHEPISSIDF